jgi:hypothetical protein
LRESTVTLILAAVVAIAGVASLLIKKPACGKALSDQDLIEQAIRYEISSKRRHIDLVETPPNLIVYKTPSEFLRQNSNCCSIDKDHYELSTVFDRMLGSTEAWVTLWYRAAEIGEEPFYQSQVASDACGRVMTSRGMSVPGGPVTIDGK